MTTVLANKGTFGHFLQLTELVMNNLTLAQGEVMNASMPKGGEVL
mgnify:CR=1 FL=1